MCLCACAGFPIARHSKIMHISNYICMYICVLKCRSKQQKHSLIYARSKQDAGSVLQRSWCWDTTQIMTPKTRIICTNSKPLINSNLAVIPKKEKRPRGKSHRIIISRTFHSFLAFSARLSSTCNFYHQHL